MKAKYIPKTLGGKIGWLDEECNEVAAACSKTLRVCLEWHGGDITSALADYNPELPPAERETNRDWILREVKDLEAAIAAVKKALT